MVCRPQVVQLLVVLPLQQQQVLQVLQVVPVLQPVLVQWLWVLALPQAWPATKAPPLPASKTYYG